MTPIRIFSDVSLPCEPWMQPSPPVRTAKVIELRPRKVRRDRHGKAMMIPREGTRIRDIYDHIKAHPGLVSRQISDGMGMSTYLVCTAVSDLKKRGLVRYEGEDKSRRYFVVEPQER